MNKSVASLLLFFASLPSRAEPPEPSIRQPAWSLSLNLAGFKKENTPLLEEIFEILSKDGSQHSPAILDKMRSLRVESLRIEGNVPSKNSGPDFPDTALLLNLNTEITHNIPAKLSSQWSTLHGYPAGKVENTPPDLQVWMVQPSQNQILLSFPPTDSGKKTVPDSPHSDVAESLLQRVHTPQTADPKTLFAVRIENPSSLTHSKNSEFLSALTGPVELRLQTPETNTSGIQFAATLELPDAHAAKRSRRILDGIAASAAAAAPKKLGAALDEKLEIAVENKTVRLHAEFSSEEMISLARQALNAQDSSLKRRSRKKTGSQEQDAGDSASSASSAPPPPNPPPLTSPAAESH